MSRNITKIMFHPDGRPYWKTLDTAQYVRNMKEWAPHPVEYTDADIRWFHSPVRAERSE